MCACARLAAKSKMLQMEPIREANRADAKGVAALLRRAFLEYETLYTPEAFAATVLPEHAVAARLEEGPLWVVERNGLLAGAVAARCESDAILIRGMAVDPTARGLGIGRLLLDQVEQFAIERGRNRLSLYTTAFLKPAIRLYETAGFRFTGETVNPHGVELLHMVKVLKK